MKKIIALTAAALLLCAAICGCGEGEKGTDADSSSKTSQPTVSFSSTDAVSDEISSADDTKADKPELSGDGDYVVVAGSGDVVINSTDDFKKYRAGYIDDCDSAVYAEFYDFKSIGMYNASNDAHSGMAGGAVDVIIIDRMSVSNSDKIVWDFAEHK